jgi:hypothetical protein
VQKSPLSHRERVGERGFNQLLHLILLYRQCCIPRKLPRRWKELLFLPLSLALYPAGMNPGGRGDSISTLI